MADAPLRFKITTWDQLARCKSNNSKELSIGISKFTQPPLKATRISVDHERFGSLFSCLVNPTGSLLTRNADGKYHSFTPAEILAELEKFGFYVEYNPILDIPGDQIDFLMTINRLKYDKIRVVAIWDTSSGVRTYTNRVVAFMSNIVPDWVQSAYSPSVKEYQEALAKGAVFCVDAIPESNKWSWDFLVNFTANIDDIIADYAEVGDNNG